MHVISKDLPDYFQSRYSSHSNKTKPHQGKFQKAPFHHGISEEAPDFFKLQNVPILTKQLRNDLILEKPWTTSTHSKKTQAFYNPSNRKYSLPETLNEFQNFEGISFDSAGCATGFSKGEILINSPKIMRNLQTDQLALAKVIGKISRIRRKRAVKKEENEVVKVLYKVEKKPNVVEKIGKEFIEPPLLAPHESRVLYKLHKKVK